MRTTGIPINPILPGCEYREAQDFGLQLRPNAHSIDAVREEIEALLDGAEFSFQLATETYDVRRSYASDADDGPLRYQPTGHVPQRVLAVQRLPVVSEAVRIGAAGGRL